MEVKSEATWKPAGMVKQTVADRLRQYGEQARARWKPSFAAKGVEYPPARVALAGLKQEKQLQVYAAGVGQAWRMVGAFPILAASGAQGPKLREGDRQVPEGIYPVESLNPNSRFHLALRIGYPNEFDREQAKRDGRTNLGGDIMIHGSDVSVGCLAVGDQVAEDLFVLAADAGIANVTIILSPLDFRKQEMPRELASLPPWTGELYEAIVARLQELPLE